MSKAPFGYAVVNLGCKVNRVEADGFERLLGERGGAPAPEGAADLIIVNTCTVTGEADKKTRKAVRHALSANDGARIVVTGCATEIDAATYKAMGERVRVVPKAGMALFLNEMELPGSDSSSSDLTAHGGRSSVLPSDGRTRVGVKVQDGCDNACTYCIVHVARGRATSRPANEVVAEAAALARAGVREIVLTGINLGSYDDSGLDLADLCRRLLDETADLHGPGEAPCRFRIGSVEPMDVSMDFIGLLAEAEGRLCRHLHLPLQSGSSKVLREMARPYDTEEYRQLVDYLQGHGSRNRAHHRHYRGLSRRDRGRLRRYLRPRAPRRLQQDPRVPVLAARRHARSRAHRPGSIRGEGRPRRPPARPLR